MVTLGAAFIVIMRISPLAVAVTDSIATNATTKQKDFNANRLMGSPFF